MTVTAQPEFQLRSITASFFLPATLIGVGQGAITPVIVLTALELGASVGVAGFIGAMLGIGQLLGDLPAGSFATRVGERRAMIAASGMLALAVLVAIFSTEVWMLGFAIGAVGVASSTWGIARHAFLTEVVPYHKRARAMSTLGGVHRIGTFFGPFIGAGAMLFLGTDGAYWVHFCAALIAGLLVAVIRVPGGNPSSPATSGSNGHDSLFTVLRHHLPTYRTLGIGVIAVGAVRGTRAVGIPLWAAHLGLDATTTSIIFGISGAVDMLLFYPAGKAMDRFGRVFVAVPCMLIMALAYFLIPFSIGVASLLAVAILLGFGNGIGSGIIMTLGSDVSPDNGRAKFLGGWRLCSDSGQAGGPVIVSSVTIVASLGMALWVIAGIGVLGAAALYHWIPRRHR